MKKTLIVLSACLMIASLFIFGCSSAKSDSIKIGVAIPLTGASAQDGEAIKNGVKLATKLINDQGGINGKKIELVVEDDKGDPSEAATVANKLAQDKDISAIVGHFNSSCTLAAAPIYNQVGVVHVSPGSSAAAVSKAGDYTFRVITTDAVQGSSLMNWAVKDLGYKNIAIVYENTDYGAGLAEVVSKAAGDLNTNIVAKEAYEVGSTDFSTVLTKIANSNADVIIVGGLYNETALIAKQKNNYGLSKMQIMGVDAIYSDALIKLGGAAVNGVKLTGYFSEVSKDPVTQNFVSKYKEAYNNTPSTYAAYGYDATLVIIDSIKKAGIDRKAIRDHMATIKDLKGATGSNSFDENGDVIKQPLRLVIQDGKFTITEK
ncbi:Leucine-, isoleucine-, valine-, threonine-, and alanine-binding protein precursor [Sporomusa ovata DSM 2662]|uniref:Branched-chain amino acid ABC transporter, amino acid-binding protein (TC 3.A.1.4.1) n=1 Tax=Sporomusa ovata TaxID=2378 RepID=A0A0U1KXU9_9FIRM|nr:ABC transporter substrate-binding protein [Sporomusa ovata]EQB28822.1 ABC transporter branched-chain amino acid-binding protein LivK [Sporomusa ovata DSM 2662]CQR72247.1 Branched-chain amino acid ABC transporter, amino acid-binding protein (TC 3.A.1.4.1) [Sporomusa ovata]